MKKYTITVYNFNELSDEVRRKVIDDTIVFMMNTISYEEGSDEFKAAIDEAQRMRTPWFTGSYIWEKCKDEVLALAKHYKYCKDGRIFTEL